MKRKRRRRRQVYWANKLMATSAASTRHVVTLRYANGRVFKSGSLFYSLTHLFCLYFFHWAWPFSLVYHSWDRGLNFLIHLSDVKSISGWCEFLYLEIGVVIMLMIRRKEWWMTRAREERKKKTKLRSCNLGFYSSLLSTCYVQPQALSISPVMKGQ